MTGSCKSSKIKVKVKRRGERVEGLGEKLKRAREKKGLGQKEVSVLTGINYKTISNYETGRSEPDVENLALLCRAYNVSADYFISIENAPDPESSASEALIEEKAVKLYEALLDAGLIKENQVLTPKQIDLLEAVIRVISISLDNGFDN